MSPDYLQEILKGWMLFRKTTGNPTEILPFMLIGQIRKKKISPIWLQYFPPRPTGICYRVSTLNDYDDNPIHSVHILGAAHCIRLVAAQRNNPNDEEIIADWAQGKMRAFIPQDLDTDRPVTRNEYYEACNLGSRRKTQ